MDKFFNFIPYFDINLILLKYIMAEYKFLNLQSLRVIDEESLLSNREEKKEKSGAGANDGRFA